MTRQESIDTIDRFIHDGVTLDDIGDELNYRENAQGLNWDDNLFEYSTEELEQIELLWCELNKKRGAATPISDGLASRVERLVIGAGVALEIGTYFCKETRTSRIVVGASKQFAEDEFFEMEFTGDTLYEAVLAADDYCKDF